MRCGSGWGLPQISSQLCAPANAKNNSRQPVCRRCGCCNDGLMHMPLCCASPDPAAYGAMQVSYIGGCALGRNTISSIRGWGVGNSWFLVGASGEKRLAGAPFRRVPPRCILVHCPQPCWCRLPHRRCHLMCQSKCGKSAHRMSSTHLQILSALHQFYRTTQTSALPVPRRHWRNPGVSNCIQVDAPPAIGC